MQPLSPIFEPATPADAEALVAVQIRAFHDDAHLYPGMPESGPPGYDDVDVMLGKIERNDVYKILLDGQIIGNMIVFRSDDGHVHLDVISIDPAYHSQGIGTQAMHFLEQRYPHATRWTLDTPLYALRNQHFYEKLGYVKMGEQFVEEENFVLINYEKRR